MRSRFRVVAENTMNDDDGDDDDDDDDSNSSDEALLEMLGLSSLTTMMKNENDEETELFSSPVPLVTKDSLNYLCGTKVQEQYSNESMFVFPDNYSISAEYVRKLTEELVRTTKYHADRTYETIKIWKNGEIEERRTLTRLENFVENHQRWSELCHGYLPQILSAVLGEEMVLFKEKLNLKPPGGSGFAPHLDSPSLMKALGSEGPRTYCTVMVAIDNMTAKNGCLRVCKRKWTEDTCCNVIQPTDANPDGAGRAGAIPSSTANQLVFEDVTCNGGTIVLFNGWVPHRSAANLTAFHRRAVFLTYNPKKEGDYHKLYYERMEKLRNEWRNVEKKQLHNIGEESELKSLSSIPNKYR